MKQKRVLSILLSLMVMISMCFAGTIGVFAGTDAKTGSETGSDANLVSADEFAEALDSGAIEGEALPEAEAEAAEAEEAAAPVEDDVIYEGLAGTAPKADVSIPTASPSGSTFTAENVNTTSVLSIYDSPAASTGSTYTTFTYNVAMPEAGTLVVKALSANGNSSYISVSGFSSLYSATASDGTAIKMFRVDAPQNIAVNLEVNNNRTADVLYFQFAYAPSGANTITAPSGKFSTTYCHGGTGDNSTVTKFKVKVPATGYLVMDIADDEDTGYSVYMKTSGFKDFEYVSSSNVRRYIGVKKGTYTFAVKSYAAIYDIQVRFYKVKEAKFGTSKKKAVAIKAKKAAKGLLITNAKKAHWYKFKNPKLKKVNIYVSTRVNGGGGYGGLKISVYDSKRLIGSKTIYPETASTSFSLYTIGKGSKLAKGTYYIKIQSYNGGNGYFTVKWK